MPEWIVPPPIREATPENESDFSRRLKPVGRILEIEGYYVWCCSPVLGPDGRTHVFYSRWPVAETFNAWLTKCEIAHAVADDPAGPYETVGVALKGRGPGFWDGATNHNPSVYRVGNQYALFYLGTAVVDGTHDIYQRTLRTKRVGLALADSPDGPWRRVSDASPLLEAGAPGSWDDIGTTNPAFLHHPNGQFWLFYKAWDERSQAAVYGNRKFGLAIADKLEGPYVKHAANPVIDLSRYGERIQCEDAYVWYDRDTRTFNMVMRDMAFYGEQYGLLFQSDDAMTWSEPLIGYKPSEHYFTEATAKRGRHGRFERPQLLMGPDGKPTHVFAAFQGGRYGTSTGVVLKLSDSF